MRIIDHFSCREKNLPESITDALVIIFAFITEITALRQIRGNSCISKVLVRECLRLCSGDEDHLNANDQIQYDVTSIAREEIHRGEDLEQT